MDIDNATDGSDRSGLVCAYVFTPGQRSQPIDAEDAARRVEGPVEASGEFLWLHFSLSNAASERWLAAHMALPAVFYESLKADSATRVEVIDEALLAVINDVHFFAWEPSSTSRVTLYVDRSASSSHRCRSVDTCASSGSRTTDEFLWRI